LILQIRVKANAKTNSVGEVINDRLIVSVQAPAVDGKANDHLIGFLATLFRVPRRQVQLISGETGRQKRFEIVDPLVWPPEIEAILGPKPE